MYYLNFILLSFIAFIPKQHKKLIGYLTLLILVYLALFDAIRINTGTDWPIYAGHYQDVILDGYPDHGYFEAGYIILEKIIASINGSYNLLLLLLATFTYGILFKNIISLTKSPLTLCVLYASLTPFLGSNRQMVALCILSYSIKYIIENRLYAFIFIVLVAWLFHKSALIFILVYILGSSIIKFRHIFILFFVSLYIYLLNINISDFVLLFLPLSGGKLTVYTKDNFEGGRVVLGCLKILLFIITPLFFLYKNKLLFYATSNKLLNISLKAIFFSLSIYLLSFCGFLILNSRVNLYFYFIFFPILYGTTHYLLILNNKPILIFTLVSIVIAFVQLNLGLFSFNDLFFPYESLLSSPPYKYVY